MAVYFTAVVVFLFVRPNINLWPLLHCKLSYKSDLVTNIIVERVYKLAYFIIVGWIKLFQVVMFFNYFILDLK